MQAVDVVWDQADSEGLTQILPQLSHPGKILILINTVSKDIKLI